MSDENDEKEKGNAAFRREDYALALKHYNKAIKIAGSGAGAVLFSNKAAALLKLMKYDACIQQCLKGLTSSGLTPELKSKIFCRIATAYEARGNAEKAMEALKDCEFTPALLQSFSDLLRKLWVRNPEAMRDLSKIQIEQARSSGANAAAISLFMERMSKGFDPKLSRAKMISVHNQLAEQYKQVRAQSNLILDAIASVHCTLPGRVCTALLSDLKPATLCELRWDEINVGKVLICRTIAEPHRLAVLETLIEDPMGITARIRIYHSSPPSEDLNNMLPNGTYLAVKEPLYKSATAGWTAAVSVVNPADLAYLDQEHFLLSNLQWRTIFPTSATCSSGVSGSSSWEALQKKGNECFAAESFDLAVAAYTDAIELKRKVAPREVADLLSSRAAAFLGDEKPVDAQWDCRSALFVQPGQRKAMFRMAKAHACLKQYAEAKDVLLQSPHTTRPEFRAEISRLDRLLREQQCGDFDLTSLLKEAAASETPRLDHADYNGGVKVGWISQAKANGLTAQRDFAPGDLLFVSKAFEAIYSSENKHKVILSEAGEKLIGGATHNECVSRIVRRVSKNKDLAKELYGLYAGPDFDRIEDAKISDVCEVDLIRVAKIVAQNAIGSNCNDFEADLTGPSRPQGDAPGAGLAFDGCGIWILASFMNHSCVPNTIIFFVGDLMFVRAAKRIRKGEELTRSYVSLAFDYKKRQRSLSNYGFKCECELCVCDLKRAVERPELDAQREAAMNLYDSNLVHQLYGAVRMQEMPIAKKLTEDVHKLAEDFSRRLAYTNRYDPSLEALYMSLGFAYNGQQQWLKSASAYERAFIAAIGNPGKRTDDTFICNTLVMDLFFICLYIADNALMGQDFAKVKEYLGRMRQAAKICWGSDDKELLGMLYHRWSFSNLYSAVN